MLKDFFVEFFLFRFPKIFSRAKFLSARKDSYNIFEGEHHA